MSKKIVNAVEARVGREGLRRRMNRRTVVIIAIVVGVLIGFVIATSMMTVSKLRITLVNSSDDVLYFHVYVDGYHHHLFVSLEPLESVSFSWNLTAWLHKYDIFASPGLLVNYVVSWTYIIILPSGEKAITYGRGV